MVNVQLVPHRPLKAADTGVQTLFAMCKLLPEGPASSARPTIDLVTVIDVSGSMREGGDGQRRIDHAVQATHALIDDHRLQASDRLAIVHFSDAAGVILPLSPLSDKTAAHRATASLAQTPSGGTAMAKGLLCGLAAAGDGLGQRSAGRAVRTMLLSDGQTSDERECRGLVDRFSESRNPLVTVGVGADYNEVLLRDLADGTMGRPYHIQDASDFRAVLDTEVGASVREVLTGVTATASVSRGVVLSGAFRVMPTVAEMPVAPTMPLGNVASTAPTVLLLRFEVSGLSRPSSRSRLARLDVTCDVPGLGCSDAASAELWAEFTLDAARTREADPEVNDYLRQLNASQLVREALGAAQAGDVLNARTKLEIARDLMTRQGNHVGAAQLTTVVDQLHCGRTISADAQKTLVMVTSSRTIVSQQGGQVTRGLSEEDIRRLTGV